MNVSRSFEVSVIVLTFNRPLTLRNCLESLCHQTFPLDRVEIVVVDGSKEPARDEVSAFLDSLHINHVIGKTSLTLPTEIQHFFPD